MNYYSFNNKLNWSIHMYSRLFTQFIVGLVFLVSSSFALSNTEFTYDVIDSGIELKGCVGGCQSDSLVIPEEIDGNIVVSIKEYAFYEWSLDFVELPNTLISIKRSAFQYNSFASIVIPSSVVWIGDNAFNAYQLTNVIFLGNRPEMGSDAFRNDYPPSISYCYGAEGWPGQPIEGIVPTLDESCDSDNDGLLNLFDIFPFDPSETDAGGDIGGDNNDFPENDSNHMFLYSEFFGEIIIDGCPSMDESIPHGDCHTDTLIIPETIEGLSVTGIRDNAFDGQNLTSVTIPDSVKHIGDYAFTHNNLTSVEFPSNLETIGDYAFSYNTLTSVEFPSNLETIGDYAFSYNTLTSVEFPSNLKTIGEHAFSGNDLTSLIIPGSVREIGQYAFSLNDLTSLTISDGLTTIHEGVFNGNNISNLNLPSSIVSIGYVAFADNQLTRLTIPEGVTEISHHAFSGNQITDLTLPISLVNLGHYAFWDNEITNLTIPKKLNNIPASAFGNNNLISIFFTGDRPTIDPYAFLYNSNLTTIIFCPDTIGWPGVAISLITPQIDESCVIQEQSEPTVYAVFDIDKDGSFDALTDGLILLRHAFGLTGDNLINGVISPNANRASAADIEAYIESHMP
jgi:hypothetical protein